MSRLRVRTMIIVSIPARKHTILQTELKSIQLLHWVTLTIDLAFRWAKVRSKSTLKSKIKVILRIYGLSTHSDQS